MRILKHGNNFINIPEQIEVYCPECGEKHLVKRKIYHNKGFFGGYSVRAEYKAKCYKCDCEWEDHETKRFETSLKSLINGISFILVVLNFIFKLSLMIYFLATNEFPTELFLPSLVLSFIIAPISIITSEKEES